MNALFAAAAKLDFAADRHCWQQDKLSAVKLTAGTWFFLTLGGGQVHKTNHLLTAVPRSSYEPVGLHSGGHKLAMLDVSQ